MSSIAYTVNGTTETGETRYLPWGKDRFTSGQTLTSYKFTGQREEAGLNLYYYGARWNRTVYEVDMGRPIGYLGGQQGAALGNPAVNILRLVIQGANEVITAFPVQQ